MKDMKDHCTDTEEDIKRWKQTIDALNLSVEEHLEYYLELKDLHYYLPGYKKTVLETYFEKLGEIVYEREL